MLLPGLVLPPGPAAAAPPVPTHHHLPPCPPLPLPRPPTQAPIILTERAVLAALKAHGIRLPTLLRIALTWLLVLGTAERYFWQPCKQYGITAAAIENTSNGMLAIARLARRTLLP